VRAARLYGPGDLRIEEEPPPDVPPGHVLVRVTAVGICGSDLHWFGHGGIGDARIERPLVLGHEMAGIVDTPPHAPQRVAIDPAIPCERCPTCTDGDPNLCPSIAFAGHGHTDGGLREVLAWPQQLLHPLPPSLTDADGAMLEPLGVAIHAVDLSQLRVGADVAVLGCGPIGLSIVQLCRVAGARTVVAVDPLEHRREAARRLGADEAVAEGSALVDAVGRTTSRRGFDVGFDASNASTAVEALMASARPGARIVLAGIPDDDHTRFRASLARRKGLTLVLVRRMKATYPRAIDLVVRGLIDVRSLVTATYPLEHADEAFAVAARREGLKVVIEPTAP
jgi:L-iditol 2-dehydrogenase